MKNVLNRLVNHETFSREEAREILIDISRANYNDSQLASFLTVYNMRGITIDELEGFRNALLELCVPIDLSAYDPIDLCGTGGDGKDTFNISTLASFVTAGAGVPVAKHGNYGVSSGCGSSNVMEYLGIKFSKNPDFLERSIAEAGICFLHAALFHPALKKVAPVRKNLGVKTFFNMLGPLVNPAFPKKQVTGVFSLELARMYGYLFQHTDTRFSIIHALDGYDELSLTGNARYITNQQEGTLSAENFGLTSLAPEELSGGKDVASAATIFLNVLKGQGTKAQNNVVCANAGMAIATAQETDPLSGYNLAKKSLESGSAFNAFQTLLKLSKN